MANPSKPWQTSGSDQPEKNDPVGSSIFTGLNPLDSFGGIIDSGTNAFNSAKVKTFNFGGNGNSQATLLLVVGVVLVGVLIYATKKA